jgi:hypothetical protein
MQVTSERSVGPAGRALGLEGLNELLGHEQQRPPGWVVLLDGDRPAVQAGAARGAAAGREPGTAGQHVPDGQHDAEVDGLVVPGVMQPVVGRAHDQPAERAEGPAQVGVLQSADAHVDRDQHRGDRAGRHQDHDRDGGQDEPRCVHQGVRPEGRQDAQLLLAVMQGVKAPQGIEPVVGVVGQPVGRVHGHDRQGNEQPAGPGRGRAQLDPLGMITDQRRRPDAEQGHQRYDHEGVQGQVARVLDVAAGQHRTAFGRPDPLADAGRDDQRDQRRRGELGPARRQHGSEVTLPEQISDRDPQDQRRYPGHHERGRAQPPPPGEP